ncbi:MAG TPA: hypothetical protein VL691_16150, partial [Vicinamibacteria bacterium]|nr:hypothetical protein [Vicinamibacteria bacterium]
DTCFVFGVTAAGAGPIPLDPVTSADVIQGATSSTLVLHRAGRLPWEPGLYYGFLRGGASGVHTSDGRPVYASQVFNLVAQGEDMTTETNISILRAQTSTESEAQALAAQLNLLIAAYSTPPAPGVPSAFAAADLRFPHQELAALTAFTIAPRVTQVDLDPARGLVPLPIDLLRDPRPKDPAHPSYGRLTPIAACTLAGGTLDAAGDCSSPAAAGFEALDGFGTTAPLLAPTSDLVLASSLTDETVQLWDLSSPAAPVQVDPSTLLIEPCEVTDSGFSTAIVVQPAGLTSCDATSPFRTRPLKDATDYAVVITTGAKDKTGAALGPGTVAKVLLLTHPVSIGGTSQLSGIDDATAGSLEFMRQQLLPVITASGLARSDIAMAYTFRTQTVLADAAGLGALPYVQPPATALPGTVTSFTAAEAFARYGVDPAVPSSNISEVLETTISVLDLLDPATGAFDPARLVPGAPTRDIPVLIATPAVTNANVPACTGSLAPFGKCSPLVVFRHGLGGGRANMLTVADTLTAQGFTVVAIDAAKHGDRSFCSKGDTTTTVGGLVVPVCSDGAACVSPLPAGAQGDAKPPGGCAAGFAYRPVSTSCLADPVSCGWDRQHGIPFVSGNFLVTANFFRTRDSMRHDIADESQVVRAIAFVPSGAPPTGHSVFDHMVLGGRIIDPASIAYVGQSLGALNGAMDVAANPRISTAVLDVGGGTMVDVFTNSKAFASGIDAILAQLGIARGTSDYLQLLAVAKLVLDPADPVNFAGHLKANTLPNLLPPLGGNPDGSVPQAAKNLLVQAAFCDQVVPNPFTYLLGATGGVGPLPGFPGFGGPGDFQLYMTGSSAPDQAAFASCTGGFGSTPLTPWAVDHSVLTSWADALQTGAAQSFAAGFVADPATLPTSVVVLP